MKKDLIKEIDFKYKFLFTEYYKRSVLDIYIFLHYMNSVDFWISNIEPFWEISLIIDL